MNKLTDKQLNKLLEIENNALRPLVEEVLELRKENERLKGEMRELEDDRYCSEHGPDCPYFDRAQESKSLRSQLSQANATAERYRDMLVTAQKELESLDDDLVHDRSIEEYEHDPSLCYKCILAVTLMDIEEALSSPAPSGRIAVLEELAEAICEIAPTDEEIEDKFVDEKEQRVINAIRALQKLDEAQK